MKRLFVLATFELYLLRKKSIYLKFSSRSRKTFTSSICCPWELCQQDPSLFCLYSLIERDWECCQICQKYFCQNMICTLKFSHVTATNEDLVSLYVALFTNIYLITLTCFLIIKNQFRQYSKYCYISM